MEVRYLAHVKQMRALELIPGWAEEFRRAFGRDSGGLLHRYRTEDAELVVVALGSGGRGEVRKDSGKRERLSVQTPLRAERNAGAEELLRGSGGGSRGRRGTHRLGEGGRGGSIRARIASKTTLTGQPAHPAGRPPEAPPCRE